MTATPRRPWQRARLYDPNNNQIASAQRWVSQKPEAASWVGTTLYDPEEGTYRCTVNWTVETVNAPQRQRTQNLVWLTPSGESTSSNGWSGTYHKFRRNLSGGTFHGRKVREQDGGNGMDTCHVPISTRPWFLSVTGEPGMSRMAFMAMTKLAGAPSASTTTEMPE